MLNARLSRVTRTGFELLLSLFLVVVFFGIFLLMLNFLFPIGTGLKHQSTDEKWNESLSVMQRTVTDLLMMRGNREVEPGGKPTAKLTSVVNTVKTKRSGEIVWRGTDPGTNLYDGDGVQTAKRSNALITFNDKNFLRLGENSLVMIRRMERDAILPQNQSVVVMAEGEVWGRIEQTGTERAYLEVSTPAADTRIRSHAGAGEAEFKISINPDQSSTISVFKGQVEVAAKGESIIISENQQTAIKLGAAPSAPEMLLDRVALNGPAPDSSFAYRDLPPRVTFAWQPLPGIETYRFMLARDPEFRKLVIETAVNGDHFLHGNLGRGSYYWRVRAQREDREGSLSESRALTMVQDSTPPTLRVSFPPAVIREDKYTISGFTEPGARVFVEGKTVVANAEGAFSMQLNIKRGLNVVVVESVDAAGNVAYRSKTIHGKF